MHDRRETIVYDVYEDKIHHFNSRTDAAKFLNIPQWSMSDRLKDHSLIADKYVIYDLEDLFKDSHLMKNIPVPKYYLTRIIAREREVYINRLSKTIRDKYPTRFKHKPVYIFNSDLRIINVVYSYKEVSEIFNINVGTVKSRLSRIKSRDDVRKYLVCKYETYHKLFN